MGNNSVPDGPEYCAVGMLFRTKKFQDLSPHLVAFAATLTRQAKSLPYYIIDVRLRLQTRNKYDVNHESTDKLEFIKPYVNVG